MADQIEKYKFTSLHEEEALTSIAISLKRIADKLELSTKQPIIMTSEEYQKYEQTK